MRTREGFTLIELMIVIAIIGILAAIAIPSLIASRKHGNESSAVASMRDLVSEQTIFREGDREHDGNLDYGMMSELLNTGLVDPVLGAGTKHGYAFQATYSFTSSEFKWFAVTNPVVRGNTGDRTFCVNSTGVIFYTTTQGVLDTSTCVAPAGWSPGGR